MFHLTQIYHLIDHIVLQNKLKREINDHKTIKFTLHDSIAKNNRIHRQMKSNLNQFNHFFIQGSFNIVAQITISVHSSQLFNVFNFLEIS